MADPVLYGYWRSSATYRVRIAAALKGIGYRQVAVDLRAGDQRADRFRDVNPVGLVPVWEEPDGFRLSQSLAIVEYLDETVPAPPLIPGDARRRALVRELALAIACDVHPLQNLRVLDHLKVGLGADGAATADWCRHWIGLGFAALEARLAATAGEYAVGDAPTLVDVCLVPQVYNARRLEMDIAAYPLIAAIDERARAHPAFAAAAPEAQPDAR